MGLPNRGRRWIVERARPVARERRRLAAIPRYQPFRSDLLAIMADAAGLPTTGLSEVHAPDAASFLAMADEIFGRRMYTFATDRRSPRVIDAGANVGVSVLFFRALYPDAHVTAFEPDPALFAYLERNVRPAPGGTIELLNQAVWDAASTLSFSSEGADAGRAACVANDVNGRRIDVTAVRLRDYLSEPVDMLKVDIEGAETRVLMDCGDRLPQVKNLFVEYHSFPGRPQTVHLLLNSLAGAGFRVVIESVPRDPRPFTGRQRHAGMDGQSNIFAYRDASGTAD